MPRRAPALLALCAALSLAVPPSSAEARGPARRARAVAAARRHLGERYAGDCSGFVIAAWRSAGVALPLGEGRSRSESLKRASRRVARPRPGDLAFFERTYDRTRDGRADDGITHVALVEAVAGERVTLLHRGGARVERIRMDLARPSDRRVNDPIRKRARRDAPGTPVLAGELFAGFGGVPGADAR